MKMTIVAQAPAPRRLGVAEVKANLSRLLRSAEETPVIVHNRGRDVAVLVGVGAFERSGGGRAAGSPVDAFLADVERLKGELGGGADGFRPARAALRLGRDPFARGPRWATRAG